jgi:hypothetical protein
MVNREYADSRQNDPEIFWWPCDRDHCPIAGKCCLRTNTRCVQLQLEYVSRAGCPARARQLSLATAKRSLPGNAPRNLLRGFPAVELNAALRQDFHLYEQLNLQFKAETFNLLNHPSFGYIDPYLTGLLFGQATKMLNQRFGASGSLYEQGGRSIQLSLKFTF